MLNFLKSQIIPTVLFGNFVYALAVYLFLVPGNIPTGGVTGISLALHAAYGIPLSLTVLVLNIILLLLGWHFLGKEFTYTTLLSSLAYPLFMRLCETLFAGVVLTRDPMLCAIFSGLGIGFSLGLVINAGSSTGGTDIPCLITYQKWRIPVSASVNISDCIILLAQAMLHSPETILYGIIHVLVYTMTMDRMLLMGNAKTEIKIISDSYDDIRQAILVNVDRGVTMLDGEGGFEHKEKQIILTIVSNRELAAVEKLVHAIDPEAFLIVSRVTEVRGHGFSSRKVYH